MGGGEFGSGQDRGQTLNEWVKKREVDSGTRAGVPSELAEKLKALEGENRELRQANEIRRKASAYFAMAWRSSTADRSHDRLHRRSPGTYGVEPMCRVLPIAPSTYHAQAAQRLDPSLRAKRTQRDEAMSVEVQRVFTESFAV